MYIKASEWNVQSNNNSSNRNWAGRQAVRWPLGSMPVHMHHSGQQS